MTCKFVEIEYIHQENSKLLIFYLICLNPLNLKLSKIREEKRRGLDLSHRKVHVFSSAKNNIYLINFGGEIGQSKSINLSENFRIA